MVTLTGENLGKRQHELNLKVNETVDKNINFEEVKAGANSSDIDMLYLIDVAAKYKNIKYIIEVLKGGDSLYISRALKCSWLYTDEFSNVINTDYLHHNIFPCMSLKIKTKFLTTISTHLRDERASSFYVYCINTKLHNIATKFLIFTSESFKLSVIKQSSGSSNKIVRQYGDNIRFLIGNSFILAKAYMEEVDEFQRSNELYKLRYLFSVSDTEYLDLIEKYHVVHTRVSKFGLRISKHILTKFKERCLQNPVLYMNILNKTIVTKHLSADAAKTIAVKLLPSKMEQFWCQRYCTAYDFILNAIPAAERFQYMKKMFNDKYPGEEFEMSKDFFNSKCYTFMTQEEREVWAVRHIDSKKEIQGDGCDYLWYKFINFDVAFPEIKKYIMKTKDFRTRARIVMVLIESARNQRDLEKLLNYYHDRHINEAKHVKESFLIEIIKNHNIFDFDHDCWVAFNKLLYSVDVYNVRCQKSNFIAFAAIVYHIIRKLDIHDALQEYIISGIDWYSVSGDKLYTKVGEENQKAVYQYLLQFYIHRMENVEDNEKDGINNKRRCAELVLNLLDEHKKKLDDCPEVVKNYIMTNWKHFRYYDLVKNINNFTEDDILRLLKRDAKNVIDKVTDVRKLITDDGCQINNFLRKIKIYFPDNVAKQYLDLFIKMISEKDLSMRGIYTAIYGIFQLADEGFKEAFMSKYVPSDSKIDHSTIDNQILYIQEGICRFACFSRPPVPLPSILMYIKGDYVQYCLPIFNTYLANLPMPLCIKFTESIIESPVSVQKHGIRLAFKSFNAENLKKLVSNIWNKTKNVSLRQIIYQALFNKIVEEDEIVQLELFETLKSFTLDLHEDDLSEIYDLLGSSKLPDNLLREYIAVGWQTVNKFTDSSANAKRKRAVILNIERNIHILDATFVKPIVEEHITDQLVKADMKSCYEIADLDHLYSAKWELVAAYLIYYVNNKGLMVKNVEIAQLILKKCIEMWNSVQNEIFTFRAFCWSFVDILVEKRRNNGSDEDAIPIYEAVLQSLEESLPLRVIYLKSWSLRFTILNRKFTEAGRLKFDKETEKNNKVVIIKEAVQNFAQAAGESIKQSVVNKTYFPTCVSDIKNMICSNVDAIKYTIDVNGEVIVDFDDLYITAVTGLMQTNILETYSLAVYILPLESLHDFDDKYESILNKIKEYDNEEVQFCLYQKFVSSDFKKRKLDI